MRSILHIDFNSYFATVEQQANPRLRGKPVGVTGGDRTVRTVIGAASIEAKKYGVKTGMQIWQAKKLCPEIILVKGDSDKYLGVTKRFLAIIRDYSLFVEVFSIDEVFMEIESSGKNQESSTKTLTLDSSDYVTTAKTIKSRIRSEIGEWMKCSIGISYNRLMAKLASSLQKPDGLVVIPNQKEAIKILDKIELDAICGIGSRIKKRLNDMGIFNFKHLRQVPLPALLASFKSYGQILYNMARGINYSPLVPFYEKEEVKSVGHRHTTYHDTDNEVEIKQVLLKLTELVARRLRVKQLVGKTVHCRYRLSMKRTGANVSHLEGGLDSHLSFSDDGMQITVPYTNDGLEIFKAAWRIFNQIWNREKIRMIGVSVSNLKPALPQNLSLLSDANKKETILMVIDKVNNKFGEFTLQRAALLGSSEMKRKPNPYLSDRRFKI